MRETFWRRCSSCERELAFAADYYVCSVSTCNRKGSSYVFCSVPCWDAHVPVMRHRSGWAEERRSPSRAEWSAASKAAAPGVRAETATPTTEAPPSLPAVPAGSQCEIPREVLIVASRLKDYVRARSGLNTSESVLATLSDLVRALCDDAIVRAREEGRKTLMGRDF